MKKLALVLALLMLCISVGAMAEAAFAPGAYTGSAKGAYSTITVEVMLSESAIESVNVVSQEDTYHLARAAVEDMTAKIVEAQSVNVDVTSGATLTGFGIRNAVTDALKQAGAYEAFSAKVEKPALVQGEEESYDLVIVGGGGSGLSAAAFAGQAGVESVLVLEKLAYTGGSTSLSGSSFVVGGSSYNEAAGYDFTPEEFLKFYKDTAAAMPGRPEGMEINEDLVLKIGTITGETFDKLMADGLPMPEEAWNPDTPTAIFEGEGRGLACFSKKDVAGPIGAGVLYSDFLTQYAKDNGAEIRLNSTVTELMIDNGAVVGVKVEDEEKTYNVKAKKVILACGGMEANSELVAKYSPEAAGAAPYTCPGNTGDFIALTEALEPGMTGYGSCSMIGIDGIMGFHTPYGLASWLGFPVWVNQEGERFTNESDPYYINSQKIVKETGAKAWGIGDASSAYAQTLEAAVADGYAYKADTLEELAGMIKVPVDTLKATIEAYNAEASGENGVYHGQTRVVTPLEKGPFYAQPVRATLLFTMTSLTVNDNCQVTKVDGTVIDNLYAAGEVAFGNMFFERYIASGSAVQNAVMTGRIAGEHAAAAITQ